MGVPRLRRRRPRHSGGVPSEIVPATKPKAEAKPQRSAVARAAPAKASTRPGESRHAVPAKIPKTAAIDVKPSGRRKLVVPAAPTGPDVIAVAPSVSSPETVMPAHRDPGDLAREQIGRDVRARAAELAQQADQLEAARVEAAKLEADRREEAARVEAARLEAKRQEAAQLAAARLEAERQEAARLAAARLETERSGSCATGCGAVWRRSDRKLRDWLRHVLETERQEAARLAAAQLEAQRQEAARQEEAARVEAKRLEVERQEAARLAAAQLEAQRQEVARQEEAARVEAKRLEAERQEAARLAAAQLEAQRQEAARQEAARGEAARLEAERQEAARQAAARQEVARGEAEKEEEARREARRRAIGRQLDEEAAQREAASNAARQLPLSLSTARRARLWGRGDPNVELVRYAEGWARKIQFNTPVETVREVAKQPHTHPMVTVAIRSDGSVESVTFVVSSGVAQVDEAIRRIVQSHEHYQAFPPALAREYDVIEIRRTWHFDDTVRLY